MSVQRREYQTSQVSAIFKNTHTKLCYIISDYKHAADIAIKECIVINPNRVRIFHLNDDLKPIGLNVAERIICYISNINQCDLIDIGYSLEQFLHILLRDIATR